MKTKIQQTRQRDDRAVSASALAALPYAIVGAPIGWIVYVIVSLTFTPGTGPLEFIGQALSSLALGLGDWLIVRLIAIGLFLLFAFQAATTFMIAPIAFAAMRAEKAARAARTP